MIHGLTSERRWVVILLQTPTLEIQLILSHLLCNVEALRNCMPRHMEADHTMISSRVVSCDGGMYGLGDSY